MTDSTDLTPITLDQLRAAVGNEIGVSPWLEVTQQMIDQFADATDDHQWIHLDPERAAKETPFGGTIAHGFLTLSLLSTLTYKTLPPIVDTKMSINYGFDKIRFAAPVKTGSRVRARYFLEKADIRISGRVLMHYQVSLEIENSLKPAFTADWLTLAVVPPENV